MANTVEEIVETSEAGAARSYKKVEILRPSCNLETVRDGRGGIFTWIPPEPIVEFNMLYFRPGKSRGYHYHPHFIEYLLVVDGSGVLVTREVLLARGQSCSGHPASRHLPAISCSFHSAQAGRGHIDR